MQWQRPWSSALSLTPDRAAGTHSRVPDCRRGSGAPGPALPQPHVGPERGWGSCWGHGSAGHRLQGRPAELWPLRRGSPVPVPSGGRSISVTGQGFGLIQRFAMVVIAEPLQAWRRRRDAGPLQPTTVSPGTGWGRGSDTGPGKRGAGRGLSHAA